MGTYVANDEEVIARLAPAVNYLADPEVGCWLWTRPANSWGYGQTTVRGKAKAIHRVFYELLIGPIPEGMVLDHICRQRLCVNPMHLQPITHGENVALGRLRKTECPHGHPLEGDNLRITKAGHRACVTCSRDQGRERYHRRKARPEES